MSTISFICTECNVQIEARIERRGDTSVCPNCNSTVLIPTVVIKPGSTIAGFKVLRRLGVGGMGEVWLAHQESMKRDIAIKILSPSLANNPEFVESFLHEVAIVAQLSHPNIVVAHDAGQSDGVYYLAISFVDGEEVEEILEREGVMEEKLALDVTKQIAAALSYAWDKFKMIHRDVKPANIMIDKDGVAKLMDMGISKTMSDDGDDTPERFIFGTPHYMSPEQSRNDQGLDFRTDLYSLGVTLYQMLTGTVPFNATDVQLILRMQISEPLKPLREVNPKVSKSIARLVEKMMSKNAADRHGSWQELIDAINEITSNKVSKGAKKSTRSEEPALPIKESVPAGDQELDEAQVGRGRGGKRLKDAKISGSSKPQNNSLLFKLSCVVVILAVAVVGSPIFFGSATTVPPTSVKHTDATANSNDENGLDERNGRWKRLESSYLDAKQEVSRVSQARLALDEYKKVMKSNDEKNRATKMEGQLRELQVAGEAKVLFELEVQAKPLVSANDFAGAVRLFREYGGLFSAETRSRREARAKSIESKKHESGTSDSVAITPNYNNIIARICTKTFQGKFREGITCIDEKINGNSFERYNSRFIRLKKQLEEQASALEMIEFGLKKNIGTLLGVAHRGKKIRAKLTGVNDGVLKVSHRNSFGSISDFEVKVSELPLKSRFRFLRQMTKEGQHLYVALEYSRTGKDALVKDELRDSGLFGRLLIAHKSMQDKVDAMLAVLSLGEADLNREDEIKSALSKKNLLPSQAGKVLALVLEFYESTKAESAYDSLVKAIYKMASKALPPSLLFKGKVLQCDYKTQVVHLRYEFDSASELDDFESVAELNYKQKVRVNSHTLLLGGAKHAAIVFKPTFKFFKASYAGKMGRGDFNCLVRNSETNLTFVASGLPNFDRQPRDGFIAGWRRSGFSKKRKDSDESLDREILVKADEMVYMKGVPTKFRAGQRCSGSINMRNTVCTVTLNNQTWVVRSLKNYDTCQFGVATYNSTNNYEYLEIQGTLDLEWLKKKLRNLD